MLILKVVEAHDVLDLVPQTLTVNSLKGSESAESRAKSLTVKSTVTSTTEYLSLPAPSSLSF